MKIENSSAPTKMVNPQGDAFFPDSIQDAMWFAEQHNAQFADPNMQKMFCAFKELALIAETTFQRAGMALNKFAESLKPHYETLTRAGLIPPQPPTNPMKAAILRKQRRDTGPKQTPNAYKTKGQQ